MLEIFINNQKVDLPSDIEISIVYENPLFSTDRIPAPYSFDFELPLTPRNTSIAGYPQRVAQHRSDAPIAAKILFAGRKLIEGVARLEPMSEAISYSICGAELPVDIKRKLSRQILQRWDLTQITDNTTSNQYNDLLVAHIEDMDFPIVAAPVVTKEMNNIEAETTYEKYTVLREAYISPYNTLRKDYIFQSDGGKVYDVGNILPAIRISYLFSALLGSRLKRNIFAQGDWGKLVMISNFHPEFKLEGVGAPLRQSSGGGASLWIEDLVPNVEANKLITELLKVPCATLYMKGDSYNIEFNKDILTRDVVNDWTDRVIGKPTIGVEPGMEYKFSYSNDVPCEIAPWAYTATSIKNMLEIGYNGYVQVWWPRQTFYCTPLNETYTKFGYKVINHGDSVAEQEIEADDDAPEIYDMQTAAELLINGLYPYVTTTDAGPTKPHRYLYTPHIEPIVDKRDDMINLSLYHGLCPDVSNEPSQRTYPYLCSSNYDCTGAKLGDLSIEKSDIYKSHHKPFADWLSRRRLAITVNLHLDINDIGSLDLRDKFHIQNRNFLIKELRATISLNIIRSCEAELVEV